MSATIRQILDCLNQEAPFHLAESWDNVGMLVGNPEHRVEAVLTSLDPTLQTIEEAAFRGAGLLVCHHPAIFKPLTAIHTGEPGGRMLAAALAKDIAVISCHTNLDAAFDGVNSRLARLFGLSRLRPMLPTGETSVETGLGRIGRLSAKMGGGEFIEYCARTLQLSGLQIAGPIPEEVLTVAVLGGSGSDLAPRAKALGADIYVTAEIKHATAIWAREENFCVVDGTHYATERVAVEALADMVAAHSRSQGWNLTVMKTTTEVHPLTIYSL